MTDREFLGKMYFLLQHEPRATVICDQLEDMLAERLKQPEQWEQLYPGMGNPFKRPTTREEKIVNPGVYEVQPETVMAEYTFQTYAAYKTDGEMKIGVVPAMKEGKDFTISKPWVGLTDEEKLHLEIMGGKSDVMLAEAIEAKLKEKNA